MFHLIHEVKRSYGFSFQEIFYPLCNVMFLKLYSLMINTCHGCCRLNRLSLIVYLIYNSIYMVQSLLRNKKFFVLFVLDPIIIGDTLQEVSFAATNGCLVFIENVSFPIFEEFPNVY